MLSTQEIMLGSLAFLHRQRHRDGKEFGNQAAGLRTHILVCTGSTLVMLVSFHLFGYTAEGRQWTLPGWGPR